MIVFICFFFQAEDGIRDLVRSRGLGDVYKRQVSGQGKTLEEAKHSALRNAIEQAFGTFISSKTDILNDELVKDEIVSISSGNIHSVEVISEVLLSEDRYATTLKTTISVTKLTSFIASKGVEVEFKGSLFAFNINQQKLNEKNEVKAIEDLCKVCLLYTSPSPRDRTRSRMPSSA